jgi:hypothetical protein
MLILATAARRQQLSCLPACPKLDPLWSIAAHRWATLSPNCTQRNWLKLLLAHLLSMHRFVCYFYVCMLYIKKICCDDFLRIFNLFVPPFDG